MNKLYNLARVTTATVGTGTITLGAAVAGGFLTFAQAGVADGDVVTYAIEDAAGGKEVGRGTYTASGTTLSRDAVYRSSGAGNTAKLSLSGSAQVMITPAAEDFGLITLGSTGFRLGDTVGTIAGLTLSGGTLSGTTVFPGGVGSGITPAGDIYLGTGRKLLLGNSAGDAPLTHSNTLLPTAIGSGAAVTDAKTLFYELGAANWSGEGVDSSGNYWHRVGLSGGGSYLVRYAGGGTYLGPSPTDPGAGNLLVSGTGTFSGLTSGSVLFAGTGGLVSQDNNKFFWDASNSRLLIGLTSLNANTKFGVRSGNAANAVVFGGTTKGVRIGFDTTGTTIEGVDNGGVSSYQPLSLGGSDVIFTIGGSEAGRFKSNGAFGINNSNPTASLSIGTAAATAQTFNTFTDASNYENAYMGDWGVTANVATYGSGKLGTGAARAVQIVTGGVNALAIDTSQHAAFSATVKTGVYTVATLPTAGTAGRKAAVNNATQTLTVGIGAIVAGGGANTVPVFDDGTNWRIG